MQNNSPISDYSERFTSELALTDTNEIVPAISQRTSFDSTRNKTDGHEEKSGSFS